MALKRTAPFEWKIVDMDGQGTELSSDNTSAALPPTPSPPSETQSQQATEQVDSSPEISPSPSPRLPANDSPRADQTTQQDTAGSLPDSRLDQTTLAAVGSPAPEPGKYVTEAIAGADTVVWTKHGDQMSFDVSGQRGENTGSASGSGTFVNGVLNYKGDYPNGEVIIKNIANNKIDVHVGFANCGMGVNLDGIYKKVN